MTALSTHISWVFLAGRFAYKVKRPVDLGFADFSTLARRRRFCREEVRVNRFLSPGVYLGVVKVRRGPPGEAFVPPGPVVDFAVRMRRLPAAASAGSLLSRGRLSFSALDRLARRLAEFHAAARRAPSFGSPRRIRENVRGSFEGLAPSRFRGIGPGALARLRRAQGAALARFSPLLRARAAAGRIREGHGDLRLEHVYFLRGRPIVVDAIEFNRAFRRLDVFLDAAFLSMELALRGRDRLADAFLSRYAFWSGDHDGYPLVDFYLAYRALVRAKVAGLVAADPATPPDKRRRKTREAASHYALARRFSRPRGPPPALVAVGGLVGSGKTTLALALSRATGWPAVHSDAVRKNLAGLAPDAPGPSRLYTPEWDRRTWKECFRRAGAVLDSGRGAVLDMTFRSAAIREEARRLASSRGARFLFVHAAAPVPLLLARLRRRAGRATLSDARANLLDRQRREFEPVQEGAGLLRVDTSKPPREAVARVIHEIHGVS